MQFLYSFHRQRKQFKSGNHSIGVGPTKLESEEIIQQILSKKPEVSRKQILETLEAERNKTAGLIEDITLLRLIGARHGVAISKNEDFNQRIPINRLVPGLNSVTIVGRVVAVSQPRTYEGKKPGKFANLTIIDEESIIRVVLWNDKVNFIESGTLKIGQTIRLIHGYTREGRNGKPELHIGERSEINIDPEDEKGKRFVCKFVTKIREVNPTYNDTHVRGTVRSLFPATSFTRSDNTIGKILRFSLGDETGEIPVVVWNEKAEELEKVLKLNSDIQLISAKTKKAQDGRYEVHVDQYTYVEVLSSESA